ncbi:MAG TPA: chemotaxis protein CheC [Gemmatimonadaceae bacterium]|jgi:chemotaxis protein CheC
MPDVRKLSTRQLDALREVANIGAGHAATALSQMTDQTIMISVPRLAVAAVTDIPHQVSEREEPVVAVRMGMAGDLHGITVLVIPQGSALRLAEMMAHRPAGDFTTLGAFEQSAIKEAGNILGSAFLNALAEFMEMTLLPTPPNLSVDVAGAVLTETSRASNVSATIAFVIETEFFLKERQEPLHGFYFMLPDEASLAQILKAVRLE